jgi:hypothetical protein
MEDNQQKFDRLIEDFDLARRQLMEAVNSPRYVPLGQTWTIQELREEFEVLGFMPPYALVERKVDGVKGTLLFRHNPYWTYFHWQPDGE